MPHAMDFEPFVGEALVDGDGIADTIDEYFAAAAGQAAHTGVLEPRQDFSERQLVELVEMPDLRGAEGVQVEVGIALLEIADQLLVPFEFQRRVVAALKQSLIAAKRNRLVDLLVKLLARKHIGVGVS